MTSFNPEYFWYFAFRVSLFWKFWKYHLEINFAWFTSQSWFYPESKIILKIKTCLFLNFEIKMSKTRVQSNSRVIRLVLILQDRTVWVDKATLWLAIQHTHWDWLISRRRRRLVGIKLKFKINELKSYYMI